MVHNNVHIRLTVVRLKQLNSECKSIVFERPHSFNYEAGDWIDIDFADTSYRGGKTYSLSSSPTEDELVISFREGISPFKRKLQAVRPGDKMYISQYGNDYGFQLKNNRASVLIAGGIGIAPFRSMLKEMYDKQDSNYVQLAFLNKGKEFLFKDELESWRRVLPNLAIEYIPTQDLKRKERDRLLKSAIDPEAQNYYIAGPTGMVTSTYDLLDGLNISGKDIRIDNFGTY